ncbi:hypothetical protein [Kitasatospora phosalacinea]|nr:hypothetical protein [Kitasatospora phosalacinea]
MDLSNEDLIARGLADPRLASCTGPALRQQRQAPAGGPAAS